MLVMLDGITQTRLGLPRVAFCFLGEIGNEGRAGGSGGHQDLASRTRGTFGWVDFWCIRLVHEEQATPSRRFSDKSSSGLPS